MSWADIWRIARRDLNARFRGLRLLLVCLFLGTGALAAIGSLSAAIERELAENGRVLLGGDLQVSTWQRGLTGEERAALAGFGTLSQGTRMQTTATAGDLAAPVELKAVDARYPLYGRLTLADGRSVGMPRAGEAWLAEGAAQRLSLGQGDRFRLAGRELVVGGIIAEEPDRLGEGFQLGPTVIVAEDFPAQAGLLAPGAMYRSKVRIALPATADPASVQDAIETRFPSAGFEFRLRTAASPGAERFTGRMSEFLTLVGLAALVIAGIGIGGGVASYLDGRRQAIATLKILGATSGDIARIYGIQILVAAGLASLAGIVAGTLLVPLLAGALDGLLPVRGGFTLAPLPLLLALAYGLLVALVFAAPPLLRARRFPAMALMRARVAPLAAERGAVLVVCAGLAAIAALALLTAENWRLTGGFLVGAAAVLGLLALLGWAIRRLAAWFPRPVNPIARAALANIHRPGAATGTLVTALGFGLAAFVLLAAVQTAIDGTIARRVPAEAPDYFVLDIPRERAAGFAAEVRGIDPGANVRLVPALRGSVLAFGPEGAMRRTADMKDIADEAWALRGERGLTYADSVPPGNVVSKGAWWRAGHAGEPLVSVDEEFARAVGLEIGDRITFGVLGVERTARVANFRRIDWESMGFNYVFVLSANALADAPHNMAATVELAQPASAGALLRALVKAFPTASVIEVGGVLDQARVLLRQVGLATLAAASVAVLAGLAVLAGAIAAARASRTYDTVVLRVLGADRRQVLLLQLAEYALLSGVLALVALGLGSAVAWGIVTQLFEFDWLPHWPTVLGVLGTGLLAVLALAIGGSLSLLRAKPAQALRAL